MVFVKPRAIVVFAAIKPLDPEARLLDIGALRRHHKNRIHAIERREAQHARQRHRALGPKMVVSWSAIAFGAAVRTGMMP